MKGVLFQRIVALVLGLWATIGMIGWALGDHASSCMIYAVGSCVAGLMLSDARRTEKEIKSLESELKETQEELERRRWATVDRVRAEQQRRKNL